MTAILESAPPRWATPRTPSRPTHGGQMAVIAAALGTPMMPWQRMVADVIGEYDPGTGRPFYREWRLTVPRQSGKTTLILPYLMRICLSGSLRRVVYTAQTRKDAKKKFIQDQLPMLERNSVFKGMFTSNKSGGEERITWANGSIHAIDAVTDKAGHGGTLYGACLDEAFAIGWGVEQAMRPAMLTVPTAQLGIVSTAGKSKWELTPAGRPLLDDETGERVESYLWAKVRDGRERVEAGQVERIASFEWSAADDVDISDPATWPTFMPAIGHTQTVETIWADFDGMKSRPGEFERAYGNRWPDDRGLVQVIPADDWRKCADVKAQFEGRTVWSVCVSEDRSWASIGAAGYTEGGRELVELIDYRPEGALWVVDRLRVLRERHGRSDDVVGLDPASPAGSLIADLEEAEFTVKKIPAQGKAQATGAFFDAAVGRDLEEDAPRRLVHRDQLEVNQALASAAKRIVGEKAFVFTDSTIDVGPLNALVYALWTHHAVADEWYDVKASFL